MHIESLLQPSGNSGSLFVSGARGKNFVPCDLEGLFPRAESFRDMLVFDELCLSSGFSYTGTTLAV